MSLHRRPAWPIVSLGLLVLTACASTPSTTSHTSPTATPHETPTGSPTAAVTSTRYAWTQLSPSVAPLARNSAGFAYDAATGTDLLTGGRTGCGPGAGQYIDTWSWNGATWTQLHPTNDGPGRMAWFTMAYDETTHITTASRYATALTSPQLLDLTGSESVATLVAAKQSMKP